MKAFIFFFLLCAVFMAHAADRLQWRELPALPQATGGQVAGVSNGTLLVIGGSYFNLPVWDGGTKLWLDTVYALESGAKEWRLAGRLTHSLAYGAGITTDDGVIVIGGSDGLQHYAEVFKLRYVNGKLEQTALPALPQGAANFGAALLGKTIYVAGGQREPASTEAMKTLWALDLSEGQPKWKTLAPLPGAGRILPVVAAQDGAVFVISGAELSAGADGKAVRRYLTDGWRWQPNKGWNQIAAVPRAVVAAPSIHYSQSHIFVFSGDDGANAQRVSVLKNNHPGFSRDVLAYHTITNTWTKFGALPVSLVTTAAVQWQDAIVIPGGEDRPGHRSAQVLTARLRVQR